LSISQHRDSYWLKGSLLFDHWFDVPHRPTRDADFLGFGVAEPASSRAVMREVCAIASDDGMLFAPNSVEVEAIREHAGLPGLRVRLESRLGNARLRSQIDIGFGDAVIPGPEDAVLKTILEDLPPPRLRVYTRASVAAEKLEAIVSLGMANTRMKDYFDLRALALEGQIDRHLLARAIAATFARRRTEIPDTLPQGLIGDFAADPAKRAQWRGFLNRNRLSAPALDVVVAELRSAYFEPLQHAREMRRVT
jgi:hypothetical protein